jgi:hypothetical protein
MSNRFASGKRAIAACDRCGQRYKLKQLSNQTINTRKTDILVCPSCLDIDHPQLQLGRYPVEDPQAVRNPRPDRAYIISGTTIDGTLGGGSRIFSWGWAPVGGGNSAVSDTPNPLAVRVEVGTVTVATT